MFHSCKSSCSAGGRIDPESRNRLEQWFCHERLYQHVKLPIVRIQRSPIQCRQAAKVIQQSTKFETSAPAALGFVLFSDLLVATTLTNRKRSLQSVTVNDDKESWIYHQSVMPFLVSFE